MRTTTLLALLAILFLQPGLLVAFGAPTPAAAASTFSTTPIPFSLGFGPSTLSRVSDGVPVYTVGDTIWAASGFDYSIPLSLTSAKADASAPSKVVTMKLLDSQAITPLHTFTSKDVGGVWNITIGSQQGTFVIPVHFVNLADHPVSLGPLQYSLDGGNLSISAQANLGDSYDQEACAGVGAQGAGVSLSLPPEMRDTAKITLIPGSPFTIVTSGRVNESSTFWFELYHPYGLDVTSANSVVVNELMTAASQPVSLVSNATSRTTVTWNMPFREGRYDVRAYFQNSTSLDVLQSRVLLINDSSWVSLSGSCQPLAIQSNSISYSASLINGQNNWPRKLYIMYRTFGVESVAAFPVNVNLSSVSFVASPWGGPLQGVKVNVSPSAGILQTSQEGNSLFVLASHYPVQFNYSLDISGGHDLGRGSVTLTAPFSTKTSTFYWAKLTVNLVSDQKSPSTLQVTGPRGLNLTRNLLSSNQTATFLLPAGSYVLKASQGENSQFAQVDLTDGLATVVTLNFSTFQTFEIILIVTAVMAAIANVLVWIFRSRSLSSRMATSSKDTSRP